MATKFGGKNSWMKCYSLLWSKVTQRSFGSTRGQIAKNYSMATKFVRKKHWPVCNTLVGSNVMQGSAGVNHGSNNYCLGVSYSHQMWSRRIPDQSVTHCWVEGHARIIWCQSEVKLLGNALWLSKIGRNNPWPESNRLLGSKVMQWQRWRIQHLSRNALGNQMLPM